MVLDTSLTLSLFWGAEEGVDVTPVLFRACLRGGHWLDLLDINVFEKSLLVMLILSSCR